MKLLLDTHTLLWLFKNAPELSAPARSALIDEKNEKLISIASLWEITIKVGMGKMRVGPSLQEIFSQVESNKMVRLLAVQTNHLMQLAALSRRPEHGDPFDRMIVAQALSESCTLVSKDWKLDAYGVMRLW